MDKSCERRKIGTNWEAVPNIDLQQILYVNILNHRHFYPDGLTFINKKAQLTQRERATAVHV